MSPTVYVYPEFWNVALFGNKVFVDELSLEEIIVHWDGP